ncbi:MAG TPA: caspase family protein [Gaiellaceae bacterium]
MARGMSLHVGLNKVDPAHYNDWDGALTACESDANDMESLAETRGFETTKLLTQDATAETIMNAVENAANELEPGDIFFISYSGHGGQVPDTNGEEEEDSSDETWLAYDRQIVDDELYELWKKFEPGVRIIVLSDSCHSGSVNRAITDPVPDPVATAEEAAKQNPRFRALPRDKMVATYEQNEDLYDGIQEQVSSSTSSEAQLGVRVLLISGCQDNQLSRDGFSNGAFTGKLLEVWNDGAWTGSYPAFHEAIRSQMPDDQQPNFNPVGAENSDFDQQDPFTV